MMMIIIVMIIEKMIAVVSVLKPLGRKGDGACLSVRRSGPRLAMAAITVNTPGTGNGVDNVIIVMTDE